MGNLTKMQTSKLRYRCTLSAWFCFQENRLKSPYFAWFLTVCKFSTRNYSLKISPWKHNEMG